MDEKSIYRELLEEKVFHKEAMRKKVLDNITRKGKRRRTAFAAKTFGTLAAASIAIFIMAISTNTAFAKQVQELPIIRTIVQMFASEDTTREEDFGMVHVVKPQVQYEKNKSMEAKINHLIQDKLDEIVTRGMKKASEFKSDYLAMGENQVFTPIDMNYDYKVYCINDSTLSFEINETIDYGIYDTPYDEKYFYSIDLLSGKNITLENKLGPNYKEIIYKQVEEQIMERGKQDANLISYYEEFYRSKVSEIEDDQKFYVDQDGNVVVFFYNYTIAPGYMGNQVFVIK